MPRTVTKLGVFIASPGDVAPERDDIEATIDQWNQLNSVNTGLELETLRWEDGGILPDIETNGQEEINNTLLKRADLLISVFWKKIGVSGTMVELAAFPGKKLAYFCSRPIPSDADFTQVKEVQELKSGLRNKRAFTQDFDDRGEFRDLILGHLNQWVAKEQARIAAIQAPPANNITDLAAKDAFCSPNDFGATLLEWADAGQPGTVLLFNIELSTFKSEDDFLTNWGPIATKENIQRVIMVLPPHKRRRLVRYVSQYKEEFCKFSGKAKFEVADFPADEPSATVTAFAVFRFGNKAVHGKYHGTSLFFILAEPFSKRELAYEIDGFSWHYDIMLASSDGNLVKPLLTQLLGRYFPEGSKTDSLSSLLKTGSTSPAPLNATELPGNQNQAAALDLRLRIREHLFFSNVPTYVLDENYFLIDWNAAFDLVFGHCGFHRGEYVVEFLKCLSNATDVINRGRNFVGKRPLFDDEIFQFKSPEFGNLQFLKTTAQAINEKGHYHGWNVALTLSSVEQPEVYLKRLRAVVEYETLMATYAPAYNRIMPLFGGYKQLASAMAEAVVDASSVLDLGAGPALLSKLLAAKGKHVLAVDSNDTMLICANDNCAAEIENGQIELHKANLESLTAAELKAVRTGAFRPLYDAVVMLNVFYAIREKSRLLTFIRSVLKPGGVLALSGPGDNVNLDILYASVSKKLPKALADDFDLFKTVNDWMFNLGLLTQNVENTKALLTAAGFEISRVDQTVFREQGVLIVATAPK